MNTTQEQLTAAQVANNTGNYAEAEAICRKLLTQELQPEEKAKLLSYLTESLLITGNTKEALSFAAEGIDVAKQVSHKELQAKLLLTRGSIFYTMADYAQALQHYRQSFALHQELANKGGMAGSLGNIGMVYFNLSDYSRALEHYRQSLALHQELANKGGMAITLGSIGTVYESLSDYSNAIEYHKKAFALNEQQGSKSGMAANLGNIGIVYSKLSDYTRALEYYHKSLVLLEQLGRKNYKAVILGNIGSVYLHLLDYPRALECYREALMLHEELGNKAGRAANLGNIGIVYYKLSDYALALDYYLQALAISEEIGKQSGIAVWMGNIGNTYNSLSNHSQSLEYFNKALAISEQMGQKDSVAIHLAAIGSVYSKNDFADYSAAIGEEYLLKAISSMEEIGLKKDLYEACKTLSDLYAQEERWQEHAEYLKKYYETEKEVQSEEAKKLADKFAFERQIAVMEKEREVTNMLLHKFLPSPIVPEIKAKEGKILVEKYESVSVLFADLVGFTKLTLQIPPEVMIEMLNFVFTKFDTIIKKAGGHRLRTIGDGYFAVCGAPDRVEQHQYKLAKAALQFTEGIFLPKDIEKHLPEGTVLDIRIGLHCGEAVCGMVGGLEKWQYDAYGDTVNTASRMESHGEPGKIHISEDFKDALADYPEFTFLVREPMFIKGKGTMNTYFLQ